MSAPIRRLIYLVPMLLVSVAVTHGQAQQPSAWWYPLGNPEATRNNPVPTDTQKAEDLRIKWRTDRLKNSPVLLVGAIRTEDGKSDQQIVGVEEGSNQVTILTSAGFVDTTFSIDASDVRDVKLSGLFNSSAPTFRPTGRPDLLGLGVEQALADSMNTPFGLLINFGATVSQPLFRLGLRDISERGRIVRNREPENRILSIVPIAVYTPTGATTPSAFAAVSQDGFVRRGPGPEDFLINSIRKYSLTPGSDLYLATPDGQPAFMAPKPYHQAPALYTAQDGSSYISLSTARYDFDPPISQINPGDPTQTLSNIPSPLFLTTTPQIVGVESLPEAESSTSFFITTDSSGTRVDFRFYSENLKNPEVADTGRPRIVLTYIKAPPTAFDRFHDSLLITRQKGWTIVAADLDGTAPGYPQVGTQSLVNNPGLELIATTTPEGTEPGGKNWVYVFRRNFRARIDNRPFYYFTRQLLSGQVVAAGDLVGDSNARQELLLAYQNTLSVLQLKPYSRASEIQSPSDELNTPFETLRSFTFDHPIVSVAIADLEGDGENDIIVSTTNFTYAIGLVQPNPYPFETELADEYCGNDSILVKWGRNIGGENEALEGRIIGDKEVGPLAPIVINGDQLTINSSLPNSLILEEGTYRVVISNDSYPYISDTSKPFEIVKGFIEGFDLERAEPYDVDSLITATITLKCLDSVGVQRSIGDSLTWVDASTTLTLIGEDTLSFIDSLLCIHQCGNEEEQRVYYRLVTPDGAMAAQEVRIRIPQFSFAIDTGRSRHRTVTWEADAFPCDRLSVSLSIDDGENWAGLEGGDVATSIGQLDFVLPDQVPDSVLICIQCVDPGICGYGVQRFAVSRVDMGNYIYPNPFDPEGPGAGNGGAEIVYSLENSATVSITIYDAGRSVVRELVTSEEREAGRNRGDFWDGKNYRGENVANGTYICVVSSSSGEQIILPIVIVKRR